MLHPVLAPARFVAALAVGLLSVAPLIAQQKPPSPPRVTLSRQVVDLDSDSPIAEAVVLLSDIRAMVVTDSVGRFVFKSIRPGTHRFVVRRLGYVGIEQDVEIKGGEETRIALLPKPVILEGLTVQADRLESRRRSVSVSVRALNQKQILTSGGFNAAELAATRLGITRRPCGDGRLNCALVRGSTQPIRVYIDDRPAFGGMEELEMYAPHELYALESYAGGRMVRAYTLWFMEDLARKKRSLDPVFLW